MKKYKPVLYVICSFLLLFFLNSISVQETESHSQTRIFKYVG